MNREGQFRSWEDLGRLLQEPHLATLVPLEMVTFYLLLLADPTGQSAAKYADNKCMHPDLIARVKAYRALDQGMFDVGDWPHVIILHTHANGETCENI